MNLKNKNRSLAIFKDTFVNTVLNYYENQINQNKQENFKEILEELYLVVSAQELNEDFKAKILNFLTNCGIEVDNFLNFIFFEILKKYIKEENNIKNIKDTMDYAINFKNFLIDTNKNTSINFKNQQNNINSSFLFENTINTFNRIKKDNNKIVFLNLYDGVNIENNGKILNVSENTVDINVDLMQILAMKQEGNAFILKNDYFQKHLKADIVDFDLVQQRVTLANFVRMDKMNASLRKHQRVYPSQFTKVFLKNNNLENQGNLYDISKGGISVLSSNEIYFGENQIIDAKFEINIDNQNYEILLKLKLLAELTYNGFMRYCLQIIDGSEENITIINKFIDIRIKETLNELKEKINQYK